MSAREQWTKALENWRIPSEILATAPSSPWIHPVEIFEVNQTEPRRDTPSERAALASLPIGGSVLDIGCGGGKAGFALVPPAGRIIGVDQQPAMLEKFADLAERLGVPHQEIAGDWPQAAAATPKADVVVCHHVFYNVSDLVPFAAELTAHAVHRVVVELPQSHPQSALNAAWLHFWKLERPAEPTAALALKVLQEAGIDAQIEYFEEPARGNDLPLAKQVEFNRIRLCLPADRDRDVLAFMQANPPAQQRKLATIWWDVE